MKIPAEVCGALISAINRFNALDVALRDLLRSLIGLPLHEADKVIADFMQFEIRRTIRFLMASRAPDSGKTLDALWPQIEEIQSCRNALAHRVFEFRGDETLSFVSTRLAEESPLKISLAAIEREASAAESIAERITAIRLSLPRRARV